MIAAEKEKFEKDLHDRRGHLSEEEVQRLMNEHAEHTEMLSRNISMEKDRQLNSLASRIAERRKMKAAVLARKHEAEIAKELVKQREERNHVEDDQVCKDRIKSQKPLALSLRFAMALQAILHVSLIFTLCPL